MKKVLMLMSVLMAIAFFTPNAKASAQDVTITYQEFYDNLSPYGTWLDYPSYGHVWRPSVESDFRPYLTNGNWVYTDSGWFWNSNYEWGWAPFHYGRWIYDDMYGWLWIPGYDWAPAWVTWGFMDGYYAWAPLMPGIGIGISFASWRPHPYYWNVVPTARLCDRDLVAARMSDNNIRSMSKRLSIVNNFSSITNERGGYSMGPNRNEVSRFTNKSISTTRIVDKNEMRSANIEENDINVYRPDVKVSEPKEVRKVEQKSSRPIVDEKQWPSGSSNWQSQSRNVGQLKVHHSSMGGGHGRR